MIYTVTFNPSLDYLVEIPRFHAGTINRSSKETIYPGGKGINVSLVLQQLDMPTQVLGFTAGFTGQELTKLLREYGCQESFIPLEQGLTRINVKIMSIQETAVNGQGPVITPEALEKLYEQLQGLTENDTLVLAGSIPASLPDDVYERILAVVVPQHVRVIVDAAGDLLLKTLPYHPWLIKPNHIELAELFKVPPFYKPETIVQYAQQLLQAGAQNVLVSGGPLGAVLLDDQGQVHIANVPHGQLVNSVGSGDSMVAGFLAGYDKTRDFEQALKLGIACGSACAFTEWLPTKEDIDKLLEQ